MLSDLEIVKEQKALDHAPTISNFIKLFLSESIMQRYVSMEVELSAKGDSMLEIVKTFMKSERTNQRKILEITGAKESSSKDSAEKMTCFKCNQLGHKQANCPSKSAGGGKKSHGTQATPPPRCPACASNHSSKDAKGKVWFKN